MTLLVASVIPLPITCNKAMTLLATSLGMCNPDKGIMSQCLFLLFLLCEVKINTLPACSQSSAAVLFQAYGCSSHICVIVTSKNCSCLHRSAFFFFFA
jgi:hypothetical protein